MKYLTYLLDTSQIVFINANHLLGTALARGLQNVEELKIWNTENPEAEPVVGVIELEDTDPLITQVMDYVGLYYTPDKFKELLYDSNTNTISVDPAAVLSRLKQEQKDIIKEGWAKYFQIGTFMSSLGFEIDNRRSNEHNDKDNIQSIKYLLENQGAQPGDSFNYKGADNQFHIITVSDLNIVILEMIGEGNIQYQRKWFKENAIDSVDTSNFEVAKAEIQSIIW